MSLREVINSEKILKLRSLIKEDIDIFTNDIFSKSNEDIKEEFLSKLSDIYIEIMESQLTGESYQVAFAVAGYVAKQICGKVTVFYVVAN